MQIGGSYQRSPYTGPQRMGPLETIISKLEVTFSFAHCLLESLLLWFESVASFKTSRVNGLNASCWAFGKWLDLGSSDLMHGLISWWIHDTMALLGSRRNSEVALVGGSRLLGVFRYLSQRQKTEWYTC